MARHEATYQFVKGRVVLACSCGFVRRYADERQARAAHGSHLAAHDRRRPKQEVE